MTPGVVKGWILRALFQEFGESIYKTCQSQGPWAEPSQSPAMVCIKMPDKIYNTKKGPTCVKKMTDAKRPDHSVIYENNETFCFIWRCTSYTVSLIHQGGPFPIWHIFMNGLNNIFEKYQKKLVKERSKFYINSFQTFFWGLNWGWCLLKNVHKVKTC